MICQACSNAADSAAVYEVMLRDEVKPEMDSDDWAQISEVIKKDLDGFERMHGGCPGYTWCECQHRVKIKIP